MIGYSRALRVAPWSVVALATVLAVTQSFPQTGLAAKTAPVASAPPWRQKIIHFSDERAILGLPPLNSGSVVHCSNEGTFFVDLSTDFSSSDSMASPEFFSVKPSGEVKSLQRMMPPGFTDISLRDFFVADHTLVTLLEGMGSDDQTDKSAPRKTHSFLSLSDHDGSFAKLISLNLRFKPLKVALFGSDDFLVLGWDETNLVPQLALLKEDGTIRRFVDLDYRRHPEFYATYGSMKEAESSEQGRATLALLQRAEFVPYGSQVLLTYPGTARPISVLSAVGEDRSIPIDLPRGFVLHDVLISSPSYPLILRAQPAEVSGKPATVSEVNPSQRLFEMNSHNGSLLKEFLFDKPRLDAVKCASTSTLTAIFYDTVAGMRRPAASSDQTKRLENATQLVIATARWAD
jgi:hypothetical protein